MASTRAASAAIAPAPASRAGWWGCIALLVALVLAAYANSLSGPLVFDDRSAITDNPSIRDLTRWGDVLRPPGELTTGGRPMLNLTFALNFAVSGSAVESYRVVNLGIHVLAAVSLFLLIHHTLSTPLLAPRFYGASAMVALAISAGWAVHPVQTASVTYLSQRAESLMGLCYLLTLYGFARGASTPGSRGWLALSMAACWGGMATKEVMVTAPLMVLLFDRTFVAGTFGAAWRARRVFYAGLGGSWLLLAALMLDSPLHQRGVGVSGNFTPWTYLATQGGVLVHYLQLAVWPHPLVFDYDVDPAASRASAALLPGLLILALVSASIWALARRRAAGFLGCWFFLILAPTSSIVPIDTQPMAENRIYLPLAAVVALLVIGAHRLASRKSIPFLIAAAAAGVVQTRSRNVTYQDEMALWRDTVTKRPQNARAQNFYAMTLADTPGKLDEAIARYRAAIRLDPAFALAHNNLAAALMTQRDGLEPAIQHYATALRLSPDAVETRVNLAQALMRAGRPRDAIAQLETALRLSPNLARVHHDLALALLRVPDRLEDALAHLTRALAIDPSYAVAHANLGSVLSQLTGRANEAAAHLETAIRLEPDFSSARHTLASLLSRIPARRSEAVTHYRHLLQQQPGSARLWTELGATLLEIPERTNEAIAPCERAVALEPGSVDARSNLGFALLRAAERRHEAVPQFAEALRLNAKSARAHLGMASALLTSTSREAEAVRHLEAALQLQPDLTAAQELLNRIRARPN